MATAPYSYLAKLLIPSTIVICSKKDKSKVRDKFETQATNRRFGNCEEEKVDMENLLKELDADADKYLSKANKCEDLLEMRKLG